MKLYTIKEAAAEIKMSQGWVRRAIRNKELPAIKFGRSVRIFEEQLLRYCRKFEVNATSLEVSPSGSTYRVTGKESITYTPRNSVK